MPMICGYSFNMMSAGVLLLALSLFFVNSNVWAEDFCKIVDKTVLCTWKYNPEDPIHACEPWGIYTEYFQIGSLNHSIDGGEFLDLCVLPEHRWFDIYIDAHSVGHLLIEIPKDVVDLKQFDFPHCLYRTSIYVRDNVDIPPGSVTITQAEQTSYSRTLLVKWDYPGVEKISYRGDPQVDYLGNLTYQIIDSNPNKCMSDYVENNNDPTVNIHEWDPDPKFVKGLCHNHGVHTTIDLAHNITTGFIQRMCTEGRSLSLVLDVKEDGYLLLNIPNNLEFGSHFDVLINGGYGKFSRPFDPISFEPTDGVLERRFPGDPRLGSNVFYNPYGRMMLPNQLDPVTHSIDNDSVTYRIPFLASDATMWIVPTPRNLEHVQRLIGIEKYATSFDIAPPLFQTYDRGGWYPKDMDPLDVLCRGTLILAITYDDRGVCVTDPSATILLERGYLTEVVR